MKKIITLCYFIITTGNSFAQQITFQKTYGGTNNEFGYAVQQTADGGYIITGSIVVSGSYEVYLIKTDAYGDPLWTKAFGGSGNDWGYYVQETVDGGYIVTGTTRSFGSSYTNIYLIKTDTAGNLVWSKVFSGVNEDYAYTVQQTTDGGYIMAGYTRTWGSGSNDAYIIKTDSSGNVLWSRTFGGILNDYGYSAQQTSDGGYIVTGTAILGMGYYDVYLVKTDTNGNLLWSKIFGGTSSDVGASVKQTSDGGYIITGYTYSFGAGDADLYLLKTDASGNLIWTKTYGGTNYEQGHSVQQTIDGGYIITGTASSFGNGSYDIFIIKTDTSGNLLWSKTFGGTNEDEGSSVQQTNDGGYILAGWTFSTGIGFSEAYLIKTDSLGNSGCNESNATTNVFSPVTQEAIAATIVTTATTGGFSPATVVASGSAYNTLCFTGINEIALNNSFIISPNPSTGNFIISFEEPIVKDKVEILNILGENVFSESIFNESRKEINIKNVAAGIYFVRAFDGKEYCIKKIIIEKD